MTKEQFQKLQEDIQKRHTEVVELIGERDAEVEANGKATKDLGKRVDEGVEELAKLQQQLNEYAARMQEQIDAIDAVFSRNEGSPSQGERVSLGEQFIESDVFKQYKAGGFMQSTVKTQVRSGTITTGLAALAPRLWEGLDIGSREPLRLLQLIPSTTVDEVRDIEYMRELKRPRLVTCLTAAASAADTALSVENFGGFLAGAEITIINKNTGSSETISLDAATPPAPSGDPEKSSLGTLTTVAGGISAAYPEGSEIYADHYGYTPECNFKPRIKPIWEDKEEKFKVLAAHILVTRQAYNHSVLLRDYIDEELPMSVLDQAEYMLLNGNGGDDITGFLNDAEIQTVSGFVAADTPFDRIRRGQAFQAMSNYFANVAVMSHNTWADIELTKGSDSHYVHQVIYDASGRPVVWSMQVVPTNYISDDVVLLGNFTRGCRMYERENLEVRMSDHHEGIFLQNKRAILAETEHALVINRPNAFVKVDMT